MSEIKVVPLASGGFGVTRGGRFCSGDHPQQIWMGTKAEALEKAAKLREDRALYESVQPPKNPEPAEQAAPPRPLACGKPAGSLHPRLGLAYGCVLDDGHDGDHKPGGNCFAHGKYVGLKCPQWPKCAEEVYAKGKEILAAPAVIEQARPQPPKKCTCIRTWGQIPFKHNFDCPNPDDMGIEKPAAPEPAPERTPPQERTGKGNGQPFLVCPSCWHTEVYWQVHTRGKDDCPKCEKGKMVTIEALAVPAPSVGCALLCLVCAFYKPWSLFDQTTCVSICEDCMAKFRAVAVPEPAQNRVTMSYCPTHKTIRTLETETYWHCDKCEAEPAAQQESVTPKCEHCKDTRRILRFSERSWDFFEAECHHCRARQAEPAPERTPLRELAEDFLRMTYEKFDAKYPQFEGKNATTLLLHFARAVAVPGTAHKWSEFKQDELTACVKCGLVKLAWEKHPEWVCGPVLTEFKVIDRVPEPAAQQESRSYWSVAAATKILAEVQDAHGADGITYKAISHWANIIESCARQAEPAPTPSLRKFVQHLPKCRILNPIRDPEFGDRDCSCGLEKALAGTKEE